MPLWDYMDGVDRFFDELYQDDKRRKRLVRRRLDRKTRANRVRPSKRKK